MLCARRRIRPLIGLPEWIIGVLPKGFFFASFVAFGWTFVIVLP
jgi:hypothetical protein